VTDDDLNYDEEPGVPVPDRWSNIMMKRRIKIKPRREEIVEETKPSPETSTKRRRRITAASGKSKGSFWGTLEKSTDSFTI